tara:strand:+ start:1077 stop:1352 length:276 start_codon:yes stop_codon:yes gene_type:complete
MSLGKKDIINNISTKAQIPKSISDKILNSFISIIKSKTNSHTVKISNFGTFYYKKTPSRVGRNPITKESFPIPQRSKLTYSSSNKIRNIFN